MTIVIMNRERYKNFRGDMLQMMKELKAKKQNNKETNEIWCTKFKIEGHMKGNYPRMMEVWMTIETMN
jgi:hypothetical protein